LYRSSIAVASGGVVCTGHTLAAVLLFAGQAGVALSAGVDEAADAHAVADFVLGDIRTHRGDDAGDFVSGDDRVLGSAPLVASGVDVGMADAGKFDVDENVQWTELAAFDGGLLEGTVSGRRGISSSSNHAHMPTRAWRDLQIAGPSMTCS
jgi:hypothetical protein